MKERICWPGVVLVAFCVIGTILSAPRPKSEAVMHGEYGYELQSSVVYQWAENGEKRTYWLVFLDHATEEQARKIEPGKRVKVWCDGARGGQFAYWIVIKIESEE